MPSVSIQFHMLYDEMIDFVTYIRSKYELDVELEKWHPDMIKLVPLAAELHHEMHKFGRVDCFWLLFKPPRAKKYEKFMLAFGGQRGDRLAESRFGGITDKKTAFPMLKRIAYELKRITKAGLWVLGAQEHVDFSKNRRISKGAADAERSGRITLQSVAFTCSYHVEEPPDE